MGSYAEIQKGLDAFYKQYYRKSILKGLLRFFILEVLMLLFIGLLEFVFWLNSTGRSLLVIAFGLQFITFLYLLIVENLMRYYQIRKGISKEEASKIIGIHFPEIQDRLTNLVELAESNEKSELLLASVEQRSFDLKTIPFYRAVQFSDLWKTARLGFVPVLLFLAIAISGSGPDLFNAFPRVARYSMNFEKPAPFYFNLLNKTLQVVENQKIIIKIDAQGPIKPEMVFIHLKGEKFLMEDKLTHFEYSLNPPFESQTFYVKSNEVISKEYFIQVLPIPTIEQFSMAVKYPEYLNKPSVNVQGNGNITVPEGTRIQWRIRARNTDKVLYSTKDTILIIPQIKPENFLLDNTVFSSIDYTIQSNNQYISEYEQLYYHIEVIPDRYPKIDVFKEETEFKTNSFIINGVLSDDYGLQHLYAILQNNADPDDSQTISLANLNSNVASFNYSFPDGFEWSPTKYYTLVFGVQDNDGLRGGKTTFSAPIEVRFAATDEIEKERLERQNNLIQNLKNSINQKMDLDNNWKNQLNKRKQNALLNFRDKNSLKELLKRQEKQEKLMEFFSRELSKNLQSSPDQDESSRMLQERLERQEMQAQKNQELFKELENLLDKLDKEELSSRMEALSKSQKNNSKNLEQILELTKKYFVTQAAQNLANILKNNSDEQLKLTEKPLPDAIGTQDSLANVFNSIRERLKDLESKNQELRRPLDWKRNRFKETEVEKQQQDAGNELKKEKPDLNAASKSQNAASRKLKELAKELENSLGSSAGAEQNAEDAETLRQILDNLISFSLEEERLLEISEQQKSGTGVSSGSVVKQKELMSLFRHVDDSLFSLSLRRAEISDHINKNITDIYYNLEKAIENLSQNQWLQGASNQQYAITGSNELAALLAKILENIQESLSAGSGKGKALESQLPDIIQSQETLQEQIQSLGNKSKSNKSQSEEQGSSRGKNEGEEGNENNLEELFKLYKQQAQIRQALEKQLEDMQNSNKKQLLQRIVSDMEAVENDILNSTSVSEFQNRLAQILVNLLKLQNATLEQGELQERLGQTSVQSEFNPKIQTPENEQKNALRSIEILNRQALPLQRFYKEKVRNYFSVHD